MKRTTEMHLRVTPTEAANIAVNARRLNLSKSQYLRFLSTLPLELYDTTAADSEQRQVIVVDRKTFAKLAREYRRQGVNFNQGIHALNIIGRNYANPPSSKSAQGEVLQIAAHALAKLREVKTGIDKVAQEVEELNQKVIVAAPSRNAREDGWL